jgi:hypothetical protein
VRQLVLFAGAYAAYELVRGLVGVSGHRPFANALRIIDLERTLHVFVEPRLQAWLRLHDGWLLDCASWIYVNAHFVVTLGVLIFVYLRRAAAWPLVRNTLLLAMTLALIGYAAFPAAPPRLLPEWGFSDPVHRLTGVSGQHGVLRLLLNPYAAVPSMHVCFALVLGGTMAALSRRRVVRLLWLAYPPLVTLVVLATANHFVLDALLGAVTALLASALARGHRVHARRAAAWAAVGAPA